MGRNAKFNDQTVINQATEVFWERGFAMSSLEDILRAVEIPRQSLYHRFKDKHSLFMECLHSYCEHIRDSLTSDFESSQNPLATARNLILSTANANADARKKGCLALNSMMECSSFDLEVVSTIHDHQQKILQLLESAFDHYEPTKVDAKKLATLFLGSLSATQMLAKSSPNADLALTHAEYVCETIFHDRE